MIENTATVSSDELPDQSDSVSVSVVQAPPAIVPIDVPVNNPWALLMLLLSVLGIGWYYRPMRA